MLTQLIIKQYFVVGQLKFEIVSIDFLVLEHALAIFEVDHPTQHFVEIAVLVLSAFSVSLKITVIFREFYRGNWVSFYLEDSFLALQSVFFVFLREHLALEESYQQTSTFLKSNSEMKNHKNLQKRDEKTKQ